MSVFQAELTKAWQVHQQGRITDAEKVYRQVLAQTPNDANAWCYLGIALHDQRRYHEAVDAYDKALGLNPEFPIALNNLGNTLRYVGDVPKADQCFERALQLKPDYFNAYKNRGTLHAWNGSADLALKYYSKALELNPTDAELHRNLGVIMLLQGRFREGWHEYRWRWRVGDLNRPFKLPIWDGSDLKGKSIVLTAEQGLGDTLHFVRFAQLLRERGAQTLVYGQAALMALLQNCQNLGPFYPNNLGLNQNFHYQCSLLDVADFLNVDLSSIPSMPGYIQPATHLVDYWRGQIRRDDSFKIGIAWQGNRDHQADMFRSIPLAFFEPLSQVPRVQLLSLQQGFGTDQLGNWKGRPITLLPEGVDKSSGAFMDTAAIMKSLDLVITSDTSIAHLAGAIGVPTWIGLNFVPDWRWLLERDDSPWYPSVRLFRQRFTGDWQGVFEQMLRELEKLV
ncbi:MAG: tetratricopeptide repeat-containing glycosyltransferase family protein [Pirellulales bacterium]